MFSKASENRPILLSFGPVVFWGILAGLYSNRFLLLSEAIFILLMESITRAQIDHAEKHTLGFTLTKDKNGHLLRLINGTQNIPVQIVNAVKIIQCLPSFRQNIKLNTAAFEFLARMTSDSSYQASNVVSTVTMIGASVSLCLEVDGMSLVEQFLGQRLHNNVVKAYNRAQIGKTVYTSKQYIKAKQRNNYTVLFCDGMQIKYCQIELLCS